MPLRGEPKGRVKYIIKSIGFQKIVSSKRPRKTASDSEEEKEMQTENIVKFLQAYPDDRLAALRAHTEDEKLSYWSCCCLVGSINPEHGLVGSEQYCTEAEVEHLEAARLIPCAVEAETEFRLLGCNDDQRQERLLPLIIAEQERREKLSQPSAEMHEAVEVE